MTLPAILSVLGHAALQSLWIGTLIALCGLGALRAARGTAAGFRYGVAVWTFTVIAVSVSVVTWSVASGYRAHLRYAHAPSAVSTMRTAVAATISGRKPMMHDMQHRSPFDPALFTWMRADLSAERIVPSLVYEICGLAWVAAALFGLRRIVLDAAAVRRVVRTSEPLPHALARDLRADFQDASVTIRLAGVAAPCVVGWHAPTVLLPAALAQRSAAELRPLLLHEAAHVRRNDYPVNVVLRTVEAVLPFQPLLPALLAVLRAERERACDDTAIERSAAGPAAYVEGLLSFERSRAGTTLAPSVTLDETSLLERARYLVQRRRSVWSVAGGISVALLSAGTMALVILAEQAGQFGAMDMMVR